MSVPDSFPGAPWRLAGISVQVLRLVPVTVARRFVPADLSIVSILPGRTLAVLYCARYEGSSDLQYSELALAPALCRSNRHTGFWISHLYVDSAASQYGGRCIWGLPKQLAMFRWRDRDEVEVMRDGRRLCAIRWSAGSHPLGVPLWLPLLTRGEGEFRVTRARGFAQLARRRATVAVDGLAPCEEFGFQDSAAAFHARLRLTVPAPNPVSHHRP